MLSITREYSDHRDWYHQSLPRRLLQQTADLVDGQQAWGRGAVMGFKTVATGGGGTPRLDISVLNYQQKLRVETSTG